MPAIDVFLLTSTIPPVIAGLDPAIHAMTLPHALRGGTLRQLQGPQFF